MEEVAPDSGIKNYIITSRKAGFSDSAISESLRSAGWPEDIINMAVKESYANSKIPQSAPVKEIKKEETKKEQEKKDELFTKPEVLNQPQQEAKKEEPKKEKKGFSLLALVAFIFSPVPFIGLGIAMAALESAGKNKQSGGFLAIIALLINIGVICFIGYILYQIFTLPVENLTGFSKYVVDTFKLM
jgi:hypothetical protein